MNRVQEPQEELCNHRSVRKHAMAQAAALCVIISTVAVPAAAIAPSTTGSTGIISVIRRVLERRNTRLGDQTSPRTSYRQISPKEIEDLHYRVFDRREARQQTLDDALKASQENEEPEVPWASSLEETLKDRHNQSTLRRRERHPDPNEQLMNSVEQRRRLRESEQEQRRRARDEAGQRRSIIQSRRQKKAEEEREERLGDRKQLREKRAEISGKRDQYNNLRMAMLKAVNRERVAKNLSPVTYNKDLEMAAQLHAEDMFVREYFDHFNPDGQSHLDRINNIGYANVDIATCNCRAFKASVGENIAKGQLSVNWAMNEWMESPSHKKNILSPYFKEMGIGIADRIWVQNFGGLEYTPR